MRFFVPVVTCAIAISVFTGCGSQDPPPKEVPNMMPQMMEALKIGDVRQRDQKLAAACRDAADEKAWPAVIMGVQRIEDKSLRDEVAEECARKLLDLGKKEAAEEVAKLITDQERQDTVLEEISAGA